MSKRFISTNRTQMQLLPTSIDEWLEEDHLARFIWDCVLEFDLSPLYRAYSKEGGLAYDPQMLLATTLYAWCQGIRSSRKIAKACVDQVPFRWLTANEQPDHCTFSRFLKHHGPAMMHLFTEVLMLCQKVDVFNLDQLFLDGTKMKANASLAANWTRDGLSKEIEKIQKEMEATDAAEDALYGRKNRGDELSGTRKERLARLKQAKAELDRQAEADRQAQAEKIARREEEEKESGKKKPGRKPKSPDKAVKEERKTNLTDPDSRIMKGRNNEFLQGYNGQATVTDNQFIVAADLTQDQNDVHQLESMLDVLDETLSAAHIDENPGVLAADKGYWHDGLDISELETEGPELMVGVPCRKGQKEPSFENVDPEQATARQKMQHKLQTESGKKTYGLRGRTVEPVFGQIKAVMGCRTFLRRGIAA
ncbi:transposase, partial [Desulfosarcina sp. OttesenSCG-928-B08]|nr:transposase [Desulfosarcina sp. OttesenSCG-928-B08]